MVTSRQRVTTPARTLTGIRALASWLVVVYHFREYLPAAKTSYISLAADHGNLAVDLFFVLSGYVMSRSYGAWFRQSLRPSRYLVFLGLRLSRIYPLHAVVLLAFMTLEMALASRPQAGGAGHPDWSYALLSFGLIQSWGLTHEAALNVPAWSVSTEWLAYLLFPFVFRLLPDDDRSPWRQLSAILMLAAGFACASAAMGAPGIGWMKPSYCVLRCLSEFSMGVCVSALARSTTGALASAAVFTACLVALVFETQSGLPDYDAVPILFAGLIILTSSDSAYWSSPLRMRWLQWLGEASYATYISHYLVKDIVKLTLVRPGVPPQAVFPAYIAAVLVSTALLHYLVEIPSQKRIRALIGDDRLSRATLAPVSA